MTGDVLRFDGTTGASLGTFATAPGAIPYGMTFGPDGNLYVSDLNTGDVFRFDGTTGTSLGTFASVGVPDGGAGGLVFGPDGNLYVASIYTLSILRFDGTTGAALGTFASGEGLTNLLGVGEYRMAFGPDGNLYVSNLDADSLVRFNGLTGMYLDTLASYPQISYPFGLVFTSRPATVPEPASGVLLGASALVLLSSVWKRHKEK